MTLSPLVEHYFRHEYGRLVAKLSRRFGLSQLETVEDAVQTALMRGLELWPRHGQPDNPSGWLYRVALNLILDELRKQSRRQGLLQKHFNNQDAGELDDYEFAQPFDDDLLGLLFACCHQQLPRRSQLMLALKSLCGFDVSEIALRLFTSEAGVYKRLTRARKTLQQLDSFPEELVTEQYRQRLPAVHQILYLMFTEGHLSSQADRAIRLELCHEAIRLTALLAQNSIGQHPTTYALLALQYLHTAREPARLDGDGDLVLLQEQDRCVWSQHHIQRGLHWLALSAQGDDFTRYHAEAGIAAEHCLAGSFEDTRWDRVAQSYELLERLAPSPLHRLNRALAVAEWKSPEDGLCLLVNFEAPAWLLKSYLWSATLADLHRRSGNSESARDYRTSALKAAPTEAIRKALERRLNS